MLYLATANSPAARAEIAAGRLGQMVTTNAGNRIVPGGRWALDNGCFSRQWTPQRWLATLERHRGRPGCLFAVVPDVVGDAGATDEMWARWWSAPMRLGYHAAYVLQNGARYIPAGAAAVFIGGDTAWKLGPEARHAVDVARRRGCWVHMGRVNSQRRLRYAVRIGCDSVDGTYLAFGPDRNLPRLLGWLRPAQRPLPF